MNKIVIIGAGQLGSRHLQGIAKSSNELRVYVIDPNKHSLILAKRRYQEVCKSKMNIVSYHQRINDLPNKIDIVIIATTSDVRRVVIENLLELVQVNYIILEKVVFQSVIDFKDIMELISVNRVQAWVNCTRRSFSFYRDIKNELSSEKVSIKVKGNDWGLACNGIHMIDLLAFLSGENDFIFNIDELENILIDSKRNGFKELKGTLKIHTSRGDSLELNDYEDCDEILDISIRGGDLKYNIYESLGILHKKVMNDDLKKIKIKIPLQMEITGQIVDQILDTGHSYLTKFDDCMKYHIPMLDAFNNHISIITGKKVTECPIT